MLRPRPLQRRKGLHGRRGRGWGGRRGLRLGVRRDLLALIGPAKGVGPGVGEQRGGAHVDGVPGRLDGGPVLRRVRPVARRRGRGRAVDCLCRWGWGEEGRDVHDWLFHGVDGVELGQLLVRRREAGVGGEKGEAHQLWNRGRALGTVEESADAIAGLDRVFGLGVWISG